MSADAGRVACREQACAKLLFQTTPIAPKVPDESLVRSGLRIVLRAPADEFQHHRQEIDALRCQSIAPRALPLARVFLDEPVLLETHETICEHVRRDALLGAEEVCVRRPSFECGRG